MNIVFFGSANFAVPFLRAILKTDHNISCVVTQPDRQKGRGLSLSSTSVKTTALEYALSVYQPTKINATDVINFLRDLNPDLFVVIAYGQMLSQEILDIPKIFSINVHASLLPKYRGAAPISWAIIKGEKKTGITIIKMSHQMDAGPVIQQKEINIEDDDTVFTLQDKLSELGTQMLLDCLRNIENNNYTLTSQDENQA
ncbi:MAG: methionyl-tRNA formyltransferase, partial [Candidatus Omnitrophica bacterium]|nr:methionyl-tRNA formyltransferase [Candidatus Omnitrophota bacterium]